MDRIKLINSLLYLKYGKRTAKHYQRNVITHIISKKYCHIVSCLKDSMIYDFIDEFLYKYYKKKEIKYNLKKYFNYYKNYLKFFCKPTFREFPINKIIKNNGEKKAEIYYQKHYGKNEENKKKKPKEFKKIFSDTVNEKINDISKNTNSSSISSQLNLSSFRLLSKNYNLEDFENKSILNLLNEINGISNLSSNKNQENNINKIINKNFPNLTRYNSPKHKIEKFQIYSQKVSPQKNKIIDNSNKESDLIDKEDNNKYKYKNDININNNANNNNKLINNIINFNNDNFNSNNKLSTLKTLNNHHSLKIKIKEKPTHKKNILSTQLSNQRFLTEENNNIQKNTIKLSINTSNSNYFNNKKTVSITETGKYEIKQINLKGISKLNPKISKFNTSKIKNTSIINFEHQQYLINNGKSHKNKGSINISSRNNNIYSYTQTFSPQITNRPNSKFFNKKFTGNKLYKLSSKLSKIS